MRDNPQALRLHLASTSPRRSALLRAAGIPFELAAPGPEPLGEGSPAERARQRARRKAEAAEVASGLVLGVDTVVECDDADLGKPRDRESAREMLVRLAGREHRVHSALCLVRRGDGAVRDALATAVVRCDALGEAALERYLDTGCWRGKAGGYGIQDPECGFMELVEGDLDTVIGLPVRQLRELLAGWAP